MSSTFRKAYRELTPDEKQRVDHIKELAGMLNAYLQPDTKITAARELALARTKLEECVMWAVKGITS